MEYYSYLRNIQDLFAHVTMPCERRFSEHFTGPIEPVGAKTDYNPEPPSNRSPPIHFYGTSISCGGEKESWKRDILVADAKGLHAHQASEVYVKRIMAQDVPVARRRRFHIHMGTWKDQVAGKDSEVRATDQIRTEPEKVEERSPSRRRGRI